MREFLIFLLFPCFFFIRNFSFTLVFLRFRFLNCFQVTNSNALKVKKRKLVQVWIIFPLSVPSSWDSSIVEFVHCFACYHNGDWRENGHFSQKKQNEAKRRDSAEISPKVVLKYIRMANFWTFFLILQKFSIFLSIAMVKMFKIVNGTVRVTFSGG